MLIFCLLPQARQIFNTIGGEFPDMDVTAITDASIS
jgi:hypothetical protein